MNETYLIAAQFLGCAIGIGLVRVLTARNDHDRKIRTVSLGVFWLAAIALILFAAVSDAGPLRNRFAAARVRTVNFLFPLRTETAEPPFACPCGPNCPCVDCPCGKPSAPLFIAPAQPMPQKPGVVPVEVKPAKPPQVVAEPKSAPPVVQQSPTYNPSCPGGNCGEVRRRFFR